MALAYIVLVVGIALALFAGLYWHLHHEYIVNTDVILSIACIVLAATLIGYGLQILLVNNKYIIDTTIVKQTQNTPLLWTKAFIITLIFIGSVSYTIAAYYHLGIDAHQWSFIKAFAIALPFILIEYQFSLRGNFYARHILGLSPVQITLITMAFYFINAWILNFFILKRQNVIWWREITAFLCICIAFLLTTTQK